ncbi:MAG: hypothetical protein KGY69_18855, partial [Bacteroidales bacterium]|nr:hypothetical protein [Bacteroidales bacterium]
ERQDELYVVYWHISDNKELILPVSPENISLLEKLGQEATVRSGQNDNSVVLPLSNRRYVRTDKLSGKELITAFQNATIID